MNRSAKDGEWSSPHYGGEGVWVPPRRTKVCAGDTVGKSVSNCSGLQSSAIRPAIIARIRPTFGETIEGHKPEISETRTGLFETDLQSSPPAHIP